MAFSCVTRSLYSILPLIILLSITPLSSSFAPNDTVTKELLDQLCSQPDITKHICVPWLTSDSRTFKLDLSGLVQLALRKTTRFTNKNLEMMKALARSTADPSLEPELNPPYETCVKGYELAYETIDKAQEYACSYRFQLASETAYRAPFSNAICCLAQLAGRENVPAYVQQRNLLFARMCLIDKVFSNLLTSFDSSIFHSPARWPKNNKY